MNALHQIEANLKSLGGSLPLSKDMQAVAMLLDKIIMEQKRIVSKIYRLENTKDSA